MARLSARMLLAGVASMLAVAGCQCGTEPQEESHDRRILLGGRFGAGRLPHSRAGVAPASSSAGACPSESPQACPGPYGTVCCPADAGCDPTYGRCRVDGFAALCPSSAPTVCGDECCLPTETCTADGCRLAASPAMCPAISCGGAGGCCPWGYDCVEAGLCRDSSLSQRGICEAAQNRCLQTGTNAAYCCGGSQWCTDLGLTQGCANAPAQLGPAAGQGATHCWDGYDYRYVFCPENALACPNLVGPATPVCCPGSVGDGVNVQMCDGTCCPLGTNCQAGVCTCPAGETECGDLCCPSGKTCENGQCLAACNEVYPVRCGDECCAPGIACIGGHCTCPDDHPLECQQFCCLPDASCTANGDCACPSGQVPCADDIETCCPEPPLPTCGAGHALMGCPDGTTRCCSENMVCCHDGMNGGAVGCEFVGFCE